MGKIKKGRDEAMIYKALSVCIYLVGRWRMRRVRGKGLESEGRVGRVGSGRKGKERQLEKYISYTMSVFHV